MLCRQLLWRNLVQKVNKLNQQHVYFVNKLVIQAFTLSFLKKSEDRFLYTSYSFKKKVDGGIADVGWRLGEIKYIS